MKSQLPTTTSERTSPRIAPELVADFLVWLVSVLATPIVLATWADTSFVVAWIVVHTCAFWGYVFGRERFPDQIAWRGGRLATSVVVWASVPISAVVFDAYGDHEAFVFLVVIAFVSLRAVVPPNDRRRNWEIDGLIVGAIAGVASLLAGTPIFGVACFLGSGFFWLAERAQLEQQRQSRRDQAALRDAFERMTLLAFEDQLTGLRNRRAAQEDLAKPRPGQVAAVLIDIDDFKVINDRYGHQAGDAVLAEVAIIVAQRLGSAWKLFRLGGDEFIGFADDAAELRADCFDGIELEIVAYDGTPVALQIEISAGFATVATPITLDDVIKATAPALRLAKRSERSHVVHTSTAVHAEDQWTFSLRVLDALDAGEFTWWGQPIVDMLHGRPVAVELLCRWQRSSGELVLPGDFLGTIATFRRQRELGMQSIVDSVRWLDALDAHGFDDVLVNLNVPPSHIADGLAQDLASVLTEHQQSRIGIEVLESEVIVRNARVSEALDEIRDAGPSVLIDDFGAGYSAFSYLADLPFDTVKLDRALVSGADTQTRRASILQGIGPVFDQLGIRTVAEGVETSGELSVVRGAGVHEAQGWFIARPAPLEQCLLDLEMLMDDPFREAKAGA